MLLLDVLAENQVMCFGSFIIYSRQVEWMVDMISPIMLERERNSKWISLFVGLEATTIFVNQVSSSFTGAMQLKI